MGDEIFMSQALELAASAALTSPNPRVGAVVVRDGVVVGRGRHDGAGHPHAEAVALRGIDAGGATLYVNLEPCSHRGRTPPCAPAVVDAGIERVVAAMKDPDERVAGRGLDYLRAQGVDVTLGVLETDARHLNAAFIHHRRLGRPLVTLKLALSVDGRLTAPDGSSQWITGAEQRAAVHRRRAQVDAILVGAGTVLTDDPSLTAREVGATRQPARVVVDARGVVAPDARTIAGPGEAIVATTAGCPHELQTAYKERGADVVVLEEAPEGVDLRALLAHLGARGHLEVYCEGGAELGSSLLRAGLVARLELYYGPVVLGGGRALEDLGVTTLTEAPRWTLTAAGPVGDGFRAQLDSPELTALLYPPAEGAA